MIEFEVLGPLADSVVWSQPLTADQVNFLKFLGISDFISGLGIDQGIEILAALDAVIHDLERAGLPYCAPPIRVIAYLSGGGGNQLPEYERNHG